MTCSGCLSGHYQPAPHRGFTERPPPGHTVVTDIGGPLPKTFGGYEYFITFTELHTRMTVVQLLRRKSDTENALREHIARLGRHFGITPAKIRCDNANEYLTKQILRVFGTQATDIRPTVPHSPQENAIAERLNKTLMNRVRSTLHSAGLPFEKYWSFCLLDTVIKGNGLLHDTIGDIPRRLWEKLRAPYSPYPPASIDLRRFRMFGEYGYIPNLKDIKKKSDNRGILVRYLLTQGNHYYQVLNPATGRITLARIIGFTPYNVNFDPQVKYAHALPLTEHVRSNVNMHHAIPKTACAARETK